MKRTIAFYTEKEEEIIKKAVEAKKPRGITVQQLAVRLKRPESGVSAKYNEIKKRMGLTRVHTKSYGFTAGSKPENVSLNKSVKTIQFDCHHAVLENNRIIIYFK